MKYLILILSITCLVSCKCTKTVADESVTTTTTTTTSETSGDVMGIGGTFYVDTLYGEDASSAGGKIVLSAKSNKVSGNGGCNDFTGYIVMNQNSVKVTDVIATEMFCEDKRAMEKKFFKALSEATRYDYQGKGITFVNAAGYTVMFVTSTAKF